MKRISLLLWLFAFALSSKAQTTTLTLTTPPCNHDGVLTATFTGMTPPLRVTYQPWGSSSPVVHTGVTGLTDAMTTYAGNIIMVSAGDALGDTTWGYYYGMPPFTVGMSASPAVCPAVGSLTATVVGGTAPYTYQWYDAGTMTTIGTSNPQSAPGGTSYGITVTDAAGCVYGSLDDDSTVYLPVIPSYSLTATTTVASCTNGTATAVVGSGAVAPFTYAWSTGATTPAISGLVMGTYNLTVIDAVGCVASTRAYVPQSITIAAPTVPTPATCIASDGSIIAFGSGGVPPYSYVWSNGGLTQSQTSLISGYYDVVVTDANGCIGTGGGYVSSSTPITVTYSTTPTLCTSPTGTATVSISGGTTPYTTMWYTAPPQTGVTATALAQGNYSFNVTDAMGCVRSGTVIVPPINLITASFANVAPVCTLSTGSIVVTPAGGAAPYSYAWSNGATTSSLSGIKSGYYHVTLKDAMGCTAVYSDLLPQINTLALGLSGTQATCLFVSDGSLTAIASGGTTPYTYAWTGGGTTSTITGLPARIPYWVTVTDALGCSRTDSTTLGADTLSSCYCTIAGTVYNDINNNCVQDPGENGIQNIKISITGRGYTFTDAAGHYSYKVPSGTYTVSENILAYYPLSTCQTNSVTVTSVAGTGCVLPVDFANTTDTIHDIHICTWDYIKPVPGNVYYQTTVITNNGTIPEANVNSSYQPDGQLFAPLSFIPGGYYSGSPYFYSTAGSSLLINPGASQSFLMPYNVPTNIPLGTTVLFKDTAASDLIPNWLIDYSPWNNVRYFTTTVVASYDPNFKEVYPKGTGAAGVITYSDTVLEYMVHFQNTGTYQAENIRVVDTLDDNLDWTSLVPVYSSSQCQVSVDIQGAKKVATFMFNNINLPPESTNPITSNGMFTYSIKTKKGLPLGTQFKNSASIYFDYNTPIKTNQTLNTLGTVLSVENNVAAKTGSFNVFPNPAGNTFNAVINSEIAGQAVMNVSDISGKTLITKNIIVAKGTQTIAMNINQLTPGMYLVNFTQNGKSQTQKLVVIKQ